MGGFGQILGDATHLDDAYARRASFDMMQRKFLADQYANVASAPLPDQKSDPEGYQKALDQRAKALEQQQKVYSPDHHASLLDHVHSLITGRSADAPAPLPAQIPPNPEHPFQSSPLLGKVQEGIHALGQHLKAAANPRPDTTPPVDFRALAAAPSQADLANQTAATAHKNKLEELQAKPKTGFPQFLDSYAKEKGLDVDSLTPKQLEDAHGEYGKSTRAPKWSSKPVVDANSPTGFSMATFDEGTGETMSIYPGITPPRGFIPTERATTSTDQFGNVTHSVSKVTPQLPGAKPAATAAPSKSASPAAASTPKTPPTRASVSALADKFNSNKPSAGPKQLDANGHIPDGVGNPQVREAANQLIDGTDKDKLPTKAREAAAALAREYGWEQGKFTPKEMTQVKVADNFLRKLQSSSSLDVLDNFGSRAKIAEVLAKHTGAVGSLVGNLASFNLTPKESEFIRLYNAAAGSVQGLTPLTRGGRPTEASIGRLLTELPNVLQSANSADAKERINNLLEEIRVAQEKGGINTASGPKSKNAPQVPGSKSLSDRLNEALTP